MLLYPRNYYKVCFADIYCLLADASLADSVVLQQIAHVASAGYRYISFSLASLSGARSGYMPPQRCQSNKNTFSHLNGITEFHPKVTLFWNESRDTSSSSRCVFLPPCRAEQGTLEKKGDKGDGRSPSIFVASSGDQKNNKQIPNTFFLIFFVVARSILKVKQFVILVSITSWFQLRAALLTQQSHWVLTLRCQTA